jgi:hypothetical protein
VLLRVAETPELNLIRKAVAKLMPRLVGMLEALVRHLHYQSEHDKQHASDMAAAYVKEQDIPFVNPVPEDPLPHKLGVPVADVKHAILPLTGKELPPH